MEKKKNKKQKVLMPWWANFIFTAYSKIYMFFKFGMKYDRRALKEQRKRKRGCIMIYTHYSNKDHYVIKASCNYKKVSFVLASYFFFNKTLNKVLTLARAISKDQFKPDITSIRKMKKVIDAGGLIAIAPAGQTSFDGNPPFISPTIVKLIRMCKADVICLQLHGVYLTYPKWRKSPRKCQKMNTNFLNVLNKEEIDTLSDEEIYARVKSSLNIQEFEDQKELKRKIKGDSLLYGAEDLVVRCPKCDARCSYEYNNGALVCTECGNTIVSDEYGLLSPKTHEDKSFQTLPEFYNYEKALLGKELDNGLVLKNKVIIQNNFKNPKVLEDAGEGVLILSRKEFYYVGTMNGEEVKKEFNLDLLMQLPFEPNVRFEVPDSEGWFRFKPIDDKRVITEYVMAIDYFNDERMK